MKAKLKTTQEIYEVFNIDYREKIVSVYCDDNTGINFKLSEVTLFEINDIDWEQRRYEIAKDAIPFYSYLENEWTIKECVELAIEYADELINQLKK